jgi:hypothetical protein
VGFEDVINGGLEHEGVVDSDVTDAIHTEPARLTATSEGLIHNVVRNEEIRLKLAQT